MTDKKQISKEAELRFAAELTKKGFDVFFPFGEDGPIDIITHDKKEFKKFQIKATKPSGGKIKCKLRSTNNWQNKKYSKKEIDFFGIYDYVNQKGYVIPIEKVKGMSEINLRIKDSKNNQKRKIRPAGEYLFF